MDLHDALTQIAEIHRRAAAAGEFRGYRALPVAFSGLVALLAAMAQPYVFTDVTLTGTQFAKYWGLVALIAAIPAFVRIYLRDWRDAHSHARELTRLAVVQFLPCLAAGALITIALVRHADDFLWALPGLWQICFSLGLFASCRLLPRATVWASLFYLATGTINLAYGQGDRAFAPWTMGLPFAIGQLLTALILYWHQERLHGREAG